MLKQLLLFLLIAVLSLVGVVHAQNVRIDLYADNGRTTCELTDQETALLSIYYFLSGGPTAIGVRFAAPKPDCWAGATWVGDVSAWGNSVGNTQTDWTTAFGICKTLPVLVGQSNYFATGGASSCCEVYARDTGPIQGSQGPIDIFVWLDCVFGEHHLDVGQQIVINGDQTCHCQEPLATKQSTWGEIKSLYR